MMLTLNPESARRIYERWMGKYRVVYHWQQEMVPNHHIVSWTSLTAPGLIIHSRPILKRIWKTRFYYLSKP